MKNPVRASVSLATSTSLAVRVPDVATYQSISVSSNGLTAYSAEPFDVTFPGGDITATSFAQSTDFKTGTSPMNVFGSDVDGDGLPDLVVANSYYASKS